MEQEQVAMKVAGVYRLTGELLLKAMYYAITETEARVARHQANKQYLDQTNWNQFMATKETKHFETFLTSEVNSKRLQDYLKGYGVGFSMKDHDNGTSTIAIDAKNIKALEGAFKGVLNDLTDQKQAEKLTETLRKSPKNMTVTEKIAYYQKKIKSEIQEKVKSKSPKKVLGKDEKGL